MAGIQISAPSPADAARGIACRFDWDGGDLRATGDVSRGEQGLVITRVEITASAPAGITHGLFRQAPLGDVLRAANTWLRPTAPATDYVIPSGRVLVTEDLLRHVALAYLDESGPGKDRAVLQRLETRFGRPMGTVRGWVQRAREDGWLGPGIQGRMGAEPGPRLIDEVGE